MTSLEQLNSIAQSPPGAHYPYEHFELRDDYWDMTGWHQMPTQTMVVPPSELKNPYLWPPNTRLKYERDLMTLHEDDQFQDLVKRGYFGEAPFGLQAVPAPANIVAVLGWSKFYVVLSSQAWFRLLYLYIEVIEGRVNDPEAVRTVVRVPMFSLPLVLSDQQVTSLMKMVITDANLGPRFVSSMYGQPHVEWFPIMELYSDVEMIRRSRSMFEADEPLYSKHGADAMRNESKTLGSADGVRCLPEDVKEQYLDKDG